MSDKPRIGVFYSPGGDLADALSRVRRTWPSAHLTAWVPAGYIPSDREQADEFRYAERERYGLRTPLALLRLLRSLRAARYDRFVVLFNSPKLDILAALSRARERLWCPPRGRFVPLSGSATRVALRELRQRARGRLQYLKLWLVVRILRTPTA